MGRLVHIKYPLRGGRITDLPAHMLNESQAPDGQDAIFYDGVLSQRRGTQRYNDTSLSLTPDGVWRAKWSQTELTKTLVTLNDGSGNLDVYDVATSGASTQIHDGSATAERPGDSVSGSTTARWLPRTMYRDELIICCTDGETPIVRYAGKVDDVDNTSSMGTHNLSAGTTTPTTYIDQGSTTSTDLGAFMRMDFQTATDENIISDFRVLGAFDDGSDWMISVDGLWYTGAALALIAGSTTEKAMGSAWPGVEIYSAGQVTQSTTSVTGIGTNFTDYVSTASQDAVLKLSRTVTTGEDNWLMQVTTVTDDDTLIVSTSDSVSDGVPYKVLRRLPFRDVASHKGSLCGVGNKFYRNRVYISPPDWNLSTPPDGLNRNQGAGDYSFNDDPSRPLLDFVDVPGPYDGDAIEATLSTAGPLLVLKRNSLHGIWGKFPNFAQEMIDETAGCLDLASAFSSELGAFWCGANGIFCWKGGQLYELTQGKFASEYRDYVRGFVGETAGDYISAGEVDGHILVNVRNTTTSKQRTWLIEVDRANPANSMCVSRWTNCNFTHMFSADLQGESEELYAVGDEANYVTTVGGAVDGSGPYQDDDGNSPDFYYETPTTFADGMLTDEHRLIDVQIAWNGYDASTPTTALDVDVKYWSGKRSPTGQTTKALTNASATTNDYIELYEEKANVDGREIQLQIGTNTLDSSNAKIQINEITLNFRDSRPAS